MNRDEASLFFRLVSYRYDEASLFFRLVSYRYGRGAMIITTNKSIRDWTELLAGDEVLATAILDRLPHRAHILNIKGRRYRLRDLEDGAERLTPSRRSRGHGMRTLTRGGQREPRGRYRHAEPRNIVCRLTKSRWCNDPRRCGR